jgi:hypothetical protein
MYRHLIDMNANELADKLEDALDTDSWCQECGLETTEPVGRQAATMLRQQQDELDALKERNRFLESFYRAVKAGS